MTAFARLATPIKPLMDNIYLESFFFFVPNRLVWQAWKRFMGEQSTINESTDIAVPKVTIAPVDPNAGSQSIYDYFGLPIYTNTGGAMEVNALPFRGYQLIYDEWFRDQNLQNSVFLESGTVDQLSGEFSMLRRGKRHDYFTSCLPWPQKGDDVTIPTLGSADVIPTVDGRPSFAATPGSSGSGTFPRIGADTFSVDRSVAGSVNDPLYWGDPTGLQVDLTTATATTINDLRVAFQFQKLLERDARGGTRYTEVIHAHFGVTSPDARQQRPEFLGGGSSRVNVSPVTQTAPTSSDVQVQDTPQGNLAAYGTASLNGHGFTKSFTEHGYVIGMINARADLTYQQGIDRKWLRDTRYDYYWPALSHIGEQIVWDLEIYANNGTLNFPGYAPDATVLPWPSPGDPSVQGEGGVFGYQERYGEYRYGKSQITGKFRSDDPLSLDIWHLSQDFDSLPLLNNSFIQDNPPIDRVIAIQEEPHFIADINFNMVCARPMPLYGVPGNIDRF